jgi:hypothetical protein
MNDKNVLKQSDGKCIALFVMRDRSIADKNAELAGKAGAMDTLVEVMRAHIDNAAVMEPACGALCTISTVEGAFQFQSR